MNTEFTNEPLYLQWVNGDTWIVCQPFTYVYKLHAILVPVGFVTDFASIPRVLWNILPPTGPYGKAAVLHDFMYRTGKWTLDGPDCTRSEADAVLAQGMVDLSVKRWERWAIYSGVRAGGWVTWNGYRNGPPYLPPSPPAAPTPPPLAST